MTLLLPMMLTLALADDHIATTDDGTRVILHDDGTWEKAPDKPASSKATEGFRDFAWGTSRKDVVAQLGDPVQDQGEWAVYTGTVGGLPCIYGFMFTGDQLSRGRYVITTKHMQKNGYLGDYQTLRELLEKKYGEPSQPHSLTWHDDLYRDTTEDWGTAVSIGHLSMFTRWTTDQTQINLYLQGDNFEVTLAVEYTSLGREKAIEQQQTEQNLEGL